MKVLGTALRPIIAARGLDSKTLAIRAGVPKSLIDQVLADHGELSDHAIRSIATELAVPLPAIFAQTELPLFPAVDFRRADPSTSKFKRGVLETISFIEKISSTISALALDVSLHWSLAPVRTDYADIQAIKLAADWRERWGMTDAYQAELQDANKLYTNLRDYIESLGILVIHRSFGTSEAAGIYAHIADGPHTIAINTTKSSKARKLFTLAYEFCHVLLREEGASNPSVLENRIERFCNKFAAYFLAPDSLIRIVLNRFGYVPSSNGRTIRLIAEKSGISQEATVIRLVETGKLSQTDYNVWRSKFNGQTPPADLGEDVSGGGGKSNPLQAKRTTYGSRLLSLLDQARSDGRLDDLDIYRLCGLKPKYQAQLFGAI